MTGTQLWLATLGAGALVAVVVAVLLALVLRTARRIAATLGEAWMVGQSVANNTLHLDQLRRSSVLAEEILAILDGSLQQARRPRTRH